jgi:hypothetical protein
MSEWDFSPSILQNILHGVSEWLASQEDHPDLVSPTRGRAWPLDQLTTRAFSDQNRIGWLPFLRGHISVYWRHALVYAHPKKDEEAVDSLLKKLVKQLFTFSLAVWELRNGVLHGVTIEESRAIQLELAQEKVAQAYNRYYGDPNIIRGRDAYLFTKKSLTERCMADRDTLLQWLRSVEVAMGIQDSIRTKASKNAAKYFLPFRLAGQQKLQRRELDQITTELSPSTKVLYQSRRAVVPAVDGLADTSMALQYFDDAPSSQYSSSEGSIEAASPAPTDDSVASPSPFHRPLIDMQFSSDSSYCFSRQHDVPLRYDTDHSDSDSSKSVDGHREAYWQRRMDRVNDLLQQSEQVRSPAASRSSSLPPSRQDSPHSTPEASAASTLSSTSAEPSVLTTVQSTSGDGPPRLSEVQAMLQFLERRQYPPDWPEPDPPYRSLPIGSPDIPIEIEAAPSLEEPRRFPQGSSQSPANYMAVWQLTVQHAEQHLEHGHVNGSPTHDEDEVSVPDSMPSLTAPSHSNLSVSGPPEREGLTSPDNGAEYEYGYYQPDHGNHYSEVYVNSELTQEEIFDAHDGDTVASTVSYLSTISVRGLSSSIGLQVGQFLDIPFNEQDDPPDIDDFDAASLDISSGNEHASLG